MSSSTTELKKERFVIKPAYLEVVRVDFDNYQEVADWIGANQVEMFMKKGEPTLFTFEGEDVGPFRCEVYDYICHAENGQIFALTNASLRDQFKKVEDGGIS